MKHSLSIEDGIRNLDRIFPSRANSVSSRRRSSGIIRRASNLSNITNISTPRSPLPLDVTEKQWFVLSSQCQMSKLKDILSADPTIIDKKDFFTSALHWAAKQGKSEVLHWLCDSGAEVNIKTGGYTPLHLAVLHCQALIVDILITDYDADINVRDYSGRKPGHYVQSDMPTWIQRALRTNQGETVGPTIDALMMSTTANLAIMHGKPVSRSWSSIRRDNNEDKAPTESVTKNRTKSILRSFRKIRNRDKQTPSRDYTPKAKDNESKEKLKSETRSRSVPDICLTPRSKKKLLQIEHPHFDNADLSSDRSCTDVSETVKSDSERNSSDLDEVFSNDEDGRSKKTYANQPERGCKVGDLKDEIQLQNCRPEVFSTVNGSVVSNIEDVKKPTSWKADVMSNEVSMNKIRMDCADILIDKNANQWKATTLV